MIIFLLIIIFHFYKLIYLYLESLFFDTSVEFKPSVSKTSIWTFLLLIYIVFLYIHIPLVQALTVEPT